MESVETGCPRACFLPCGSRRAPEVWSRPGGGQGEGRHLLRGWQSATRAVASVGSPYRESCGFGEVFSLDAVLSQWLLVAAGREPARSSPPALARVSFPSPSR